MVIGVRVNSFMEGCTMSRNTKDLKVIFVFANRTNTFYGPDDHYSITDHARVTARTHQTKRMTVFDIKFPRG